MCEKLPTYWRGLLVVDDVPLNYRGATEAIQHWQGKGSQVEVVSVSG